MPSSGSSRKRKRACGEPTIHPRNRYADKPPDFALLASLYPSFAPFVFYHPSRNGLPRIDWTDFNATRELTRILLLHDHGIDWWIPDGQLCPTVPNRSNYIHWIEDLLASDIIPKSTSGEDKVRGFDIGTGANCIYPLLGASLLGWSFVASDFTPVALDWAEKNVKSNPKISNLIEIRKVENVGATKDDGVAGGARIEENIQSNPSLLDIAETTEVVESPSLDPQCNLDNVQILGVEDKGELAFVEGGVLETQSLCGEHEHVDVRYNGPPILLGVVKDGEKFDFCMCNPPFFESMEESGLNPKTACGGTPEEMVCTGGERAFISRIIEDSVILGQSFRWYTSMIGKKSNLKFLIAKLRDVGVTIVKTTEFVQGRTSRWGLAWSFLTPTTKLVLRHATEKNNMSFMLEGFQRQVSAFTVLQSVESFFLKFNASCKVNSSTFTVDVTISNHHCNILLNNEVKSLDEEVLTGQHADKHSDSSYLPDSADQLSFRVSVFQQIPGTLLVKGSLQQRNGPLSGTFSSVFRTLDEFLRCNFCKDRAVRDNLN